MTIKFKPRPLLLVVLLAVILLILGISWVYLASPVDKNDKKDIQMKKYFSISRSACHYNHTCMVEAIAISDSPPRHHLLASL